MNLADAVFAIALTLLVLNLVVPADLSGPELAGALRDQVPYPTSLIGTAPDARAAALPFIGVFLVLSVLWLVLILYAQRVSAWRRPMPRHIFPWLVSDWVVSIAALVVAMLVTLADPIAGLVVLAVGSAATRMVMSRLGPERSTWF